ncbi:hypothetical protein SLEP1_g59325 [Rubroshorea leprosula]|uniref:Integrase catalytic domain-containing protein n=1 Tax=Rubroshorea leprosula TaxID=152421 RepID=A0AAV5MWJ1_9ROSI|nr:hypothetical protein SLEP1_g59325 [Rubroshorea leprosula]
MEQELGHHVAQMIPNNYQPRSLDIPPFIVELALPSWVAQQWRNGKSKVDSSNFGYADMLVPDRIVLHYSSTMADEKDGSTMIKLNTSNYSLWKTLMEDKLFCKHLYDPIEHKGIKPAEMNDADWKKIDRKAYAVICKWVDMSVIHHVGQEKESYKLWTKLEELFERKNALKKASLIRKLVNLKYKEGKNVSEHLNNFQEILNELVTVKLAIDDEVQALILLSSLPDSWETLVVTLSNSTRDGEMTLQLVKDSILSEESRRKEQGIMSSESEALVTEYRGRSKQRYIRRDNDRQSQERDCWHNKDKYVKKRADTHEEKEAKENITAITSNGEVYLLCENNSIDVAHHDSTWVVDTVASYHVTPNRDWFSSYKEGDFGSLKMGNRSEAKIVGVGDVWLETNIGSKLHLKNVRHVPEIRLNLMSTGMLDDDGYLNYFEADATELWHKRLGHLSEKGLQILSKKELLPDFTRNLSKTYADCLDGKHHRVSFHTLPLSRRKYALDLVHTDVCFMKDKSLGGATYFVTFVDDFSRKLWAYPLFSKDQVLEKFKEFQAMTERETGRKLKCIRSDNGGEYSGQFERYCREQGIKLEKTTLRTPQHNGVAERINRTICDRIVCMLSHAKLPKPFWGEALKTAVYLINRSPSVVLNGDVPEKIWSGKEVSYKHLRVFGCRAYVHVPKEERAKLDEKTNNVYSWDMNETVEDSKKQDDSEHTQEIPNTDYCTPTPKPSVMNDDDSEVDEQQVQGPVVEHFVEEETNQEEQVQPPQQPQVKRSTRLHQPSQKYSTNEYVLLTDGGEPETYYEAMESENKKEWLMAMQEEMSSLQENGTYELVELPKDKKALNNKWVFRVKSEVNNPNPRFKARLVVKGFRQQKGIDYDEIFSPVVKMPSIRAILALAASLNLEIEQLDVKTAFLHGDLEEEIYMKQPEGFEVQGKKNLVCKLKKSLYGLKQAPRQWYHGDFLILLLYVDDMLIVGHDTKKIATLKTYLSKSFSMKDLGPAKQILGMKIFRDRKNKKLWLSQERYIEKVLDKFNMSKAKPVGTPLAGHFKLSTEQCPTSKEEAEYMKNVPYASTVGSLMYAMVCTRPDIAHAVRVVSKFLSNPGKQHWAASTLEHEPYEATNLEWHNFVPYSVYLKMNGAILAGGQ